MERCNSSVSLVARKVECEGFLRSSREKEEDYLVIFSDESDSSYMSALIDQLSSSSNDRSTVVWGDEVVRSLLRLRDSSFWDDNYMVYETSLYLRHQISEKDLDIGRHKHCTKC